jgi:hypothetical protein
VEIYFAKIEDLKIALWRALIYPVAHKRQLDELENGFRASIAVTEAQWKAFYTQNPTTIPPSGRLVGNTDVSSHSPFFSFE